MRLILGLVLLCGLATGSFALGADGSPITDATVCDLLEHPLEFANRHVRVQAVVVSGPEFFGLAYVDCLSARGRIWLERAGDDDDISKYDRGWSVHEFVRAGTSGQLNESSIAWQVPVRVRPLDKKELKSLYRALRRSRGEGVEAVVEGRFDSAEGGLLVPSDQGGFSLFSAFGHLNCCTSRIVVEHVEVAVEGD